MKTAGVNLGAADSLSREPGRGGPGGDSRDFKCLTPPGKPPRLASFLSVELRFP
jgi:hypothetical protein